MFHNVNVNYTNVDEATLIFEKTILDGEELIVLGKNENWCTNPIPDENFALGGEELSLAKPLYECYEAPPASYEFPRNELSSGRDSNTQTTLGRGSLNHMTHANHKLLKPLLNLHAIFAWNSSPLDM